MKKESNLKRLLRYAGGYKYLTIASWILSALSALVALLPFVYIWKVIKEVLDVAPEYGDVQDLSHNGWMAVVFAAAAKSGRSFMNPVRQRKPTLPTSFPTRRMPLRHLWGLSFFCLSLTGGWGF